MPGTPDLTAAARTAEQFLQAIQRGDQAAAKSMLVERDRESTNFPTADGAELSYELETPQAEGELVVIKATLRAKPPGETAAQEQPMPLTLRQEEGVWRVDMSASIERLMGVDVGKALSEVAEGLGQAMAKGMEAMGEAMTEAMKGLSSPEEDESAKTEEGPARLEDASDEGKDETR